MEIDRPIEDQEDDDGHEEDGQRRNYSRVDAYIPFEYRIVDDEEKDHIHARISGDGAAQELRQIPDLADHDHIFGEWLQVINVKLDAIIRLMTLQSEGYFTLPFKAISISGGGMGFMLPKAIVLGTVLEIKLMLTWSQPVAMCLYGQVTKSIPRDGSYYTAIRYIHMDVSIRDEIIRFVFEREREIIREKRG